MRWEHGDSCINCVCLLLPHNYKCYFMYMLLYDMTLLKYLITGMVETDPEGALAGFDQVVRMEPEKAEW